jgi:hypothetical protein
LKKLDLGNPYGCYHLKKLDLGNPYGCYHLKKLDLGNPYGCYHLKKLDLGNSNGFVLVPHTHVYHMVHVSVKKHSHWLSRDFVFKATMLKPRLQKTSYKGRISLPPNLFPHNLPSMHPKRKVGKRKFVRTHVPKIDKSNPNPNLLLIRTY